MSPALLCSMGLLSLLGLILARIPIAIAMLMVALSGSALLSLGFDQFVLSSFLLQFKSLFWNIVSNYELTLIPLFILMGHLAHSCKLSDDLFSAMQALLHRLNGRLALAVITTSAGFGSVCGSSLATTATMSRLSITAFRENGYRDQDAASILAAGGTLGILIPPSVILVIYAVAVEVSVLELFRAAIVPALMAVALFCSVIYFRYRKIHSQPKKKISMQTLIIKLTPSLLLFTVMIGGIGTGLFTPVPAASIAVCFLLIYGYLRNRNLRVYKETLQRALLSTSRTTAMIYFILFAAEVLKIFFVRAGLPSVILDIASLAEIINPLFLLFAILLLMILLGCIMESLSLVLVVVPFLWPLLVALNGGALATADASTFGLDVEGLKIWFGILCLIVIELGLITPPLGINMLIVQDVIGTIDIKGYALCILPFLGVELFRVVLLLFFPNLALFWQG